MGDTPVLENPEPDVPTRTATLIEERARHALAALKELFATEVAPDRVAAA